jgi:hypothetical protein
MQDCEIKERGVSGTWSTQEGGDKYVQNSDRESQREEILEAYVEGQY